MKKYVVDILIGLLVLGLIAVVVLSARAFGFR